MCLPDYWEEESEVTLLVYKHDVLPADPKFPHFYNVEGMISGKYVNVHTLNDLVAGAQYVMPDILKDYPAENMYEITFKCAFDTVSPQDVSVKKAEMWYEPEEE